MNRLKNIKLYLFDMDGTLYLGNLLYDFTKELLSTIKDSGATYMYMTNNSSKSVKDYIAKLNKLGITATEDEFITSSQATVYFLKNNYPDEKIYVCGTQSLKEEFIKEGFCLTDSVDETTLIVMGNDTELTFKKLHDVCEILLTKENVKYVATNLDIVCPTEFGSVPDCGSFCEMIYNCTGRRPELVGKPQPIMPILAMEKTGYGKEQTAVIGDRIYTDVKSGLNAGVLSILVMSGETTKEILESSEDKPDLVLKDCSEIITTINGEN
ncbi:MAG: HAD-IIA family hydrolase [Acutalibacteraceae bacterium]|nr:HAD-IIA family hydrolase [Acutalibacteraceae bacterium]